MTTQQLSFSPAAERNAAPIDEVLQHVLRPDMRVLELGSGTGQHAVFLAQQHPTLQWTPTELPENLADLQARIDAAQLPNIAPAQALNAIEGPWPEETFDLIFTANTFHIMDDRGWKSVIDHAPEHLRDGGWLCVYGPMRYRNRPLEPSNQQFETFLQGVDPQRAIRCADAIAERAQALGLTLVEDHAMPANNRLLRFQKQTHAS